MPKQPQDFVLGGRSWPICYPARHPEGFLRWTCRSQAGVLKDTLKDKTSLASRAHGSQTSWPPRPQPPCYHRPPGQHVRAGGLQQNLASTFGPAQYNPAAARRGRGLGAHGQGVGEQGGRGSPAGAHQAEATRRRGHSVSPGAGCLFWVWPAPPSRSRQWGASARLGCALVCACAAAAPVPRRR